MQSKAATVEQYLAELPDERRAAIEAVRKVILKNLDKDYEEGMQYGMIGYYVPHRVYPAGYHCDPKQPLCFAALASQKNYMSLYIMSIYGEPTDRNWFEREWAKAGKKLNAGKCCIRFKRVEDLALDVIAEAVRRMPARKYIRYCESALAKSKSTTRQKSKARKAGTSTRKTAGRRRAKTGRAATK
jgi:hypothetical protein